MHVSAVHLLRRTTLIAQTVASADARLAQVVVSAGRANAILWDAQSATFLGTLAPFGSAPDSSAAIDVTAGLELDRVSQRALRGPSAPVPPLGAASVMPEESFDDPKFRQQLSHAASTAHSLASTFARKCALVAAACTLALRRLRAG